MQFVNVDDPSLLLQNHLEPRLPALRGEPICKTQLDEDSMDFGQGGAGGSGLVVAKVEAREEGGGTFPSAVPVGLEIVGSDGGGHQGKHWRDGRG